MGKRIEVFFLGRKLKFELNNDVDEEKFRRIMRFLECKYRETRTEAPGIDSFKLGLLVSIHLAQELIDEKDRQQEIDGFLHRINRMIS